MFCITVRARVPVILCGRECSGKPGGYCCGGRHSAVDRGGLGDGLATAPGGCIVGRSVCRRSKRYGSVCAVASRWSAPHECRAHVVENQVTAAAGIRRFVALLRSPVAGVQEAAAMVLMVLARNGAPPCAASRAVAAVRRCRTLTVARARRRQRVCDCGGRRHCAADCAAPLTCRGSGRSSGEGVVEPELQQRCAAVRCGARGCGGPLVLHAHRRARPQSTTSLRLRRLEAFRRWLRCSAHLSPEFRLLQPLHCGESA